jgi:hypothetical protein
VTQESQDRRDQERQHGSEPDDTVDGSGVVVADRPTFDVGDRCHHDRQQGVKAIIDAAIPIASVTSSRVRASG